MQAADAGAGPAVEVRRWTLGGALGGASAFLAVLRLQCPSGIPQ